MKRLMIALLGLAVATLASTGATGESYNRSRHLSAGKQAKVNSLLSRAYAQDGSGEAEGADDPCRRGNVEIGNVKSSRGRAPTDLTVVILGDVTNVNTGFGDGC